MPKISRQVKEIIQIVVFLLVVGAIAYFYVIYPLGKTKAIMGRPDLDDYNNDSLAVNDPTLYVEAGLTPDTFRVEADGLTNLACIYLAPTLDSAETIKGTIFLLHNMIGDRDSVIGLASTFLADGYAVAAYDQRASGRSSGRYRGEGGYEATDLIELIRFLDLRERIVHPVIVIGYSIGGDAALLAALEEKRIDRVIAIDAYLSTDRMIDRIMGDNDLLWFPFRSTMFWWWYNIRSSYAAPYRETENVKAVACATLLIVPDDAMQDEEVVKIQDLSGNERLTIMTSDFSDSAVLESIRAFLE